MAWHINRYGIVVQSIADGPCPLGRSRRRAQSLIAHYRAARDFPQLLQNFFLKRAHHHTQVGVPAQRICVTIEIAPNLSADFFDTPSVFNGIQYQPKLCDRTFEIVAAGQIVDEHNTALAQRHQQITQRRIHHADCDLRPANLFERVIDTALRAAQQRLDFLVAEFAADCANKFFYIHIDHHRDLSFLSACEIFARAPLRVQSRGYFRVIQAGEIAQLQRFALFCRKREHQLAQAHSRIAVIFVVCSMRFAEPVGRRICLIISDDHGGAPGAVARSIAA